MGTHPGVTHPLVDLYGLVIDNCQQQKPVDLEVSSATSVT
jgi:hypothetical protein